MIARSPAGGLANAVGLPEQGPLQRDRFRTAEHANAQAFDPWRVAPDFEGEALKFEPQDLIRGTDPAPIVRQRPAARARSLNLGRTRWGFQTTRPWPAR